MDFVVHFVGVSLAKPQEDESSSCPERSAIWSPATRATLTGLLGPRDPLESPVSVHENSRKEQQHDGKKNLLFRASAGTTQEGSDRRRDQEQAKTDPPKPDERGHLDDWQKVGLGIAEVAERSVRRSSAQRNSAATHATGTARAACQTPPRRIQARNSKLQHPKAIEGKINRTSKPGMEPIVRASSHRFRLPNSQAHAARVKASQARTRGAATSTGKGASRSANARDAGPRQKTITPPSRPERKSPATIDAGRIAGVSSRCNSSLESGVCSFPTPPAGCKMPDANWRFADGRSRHLEAV